MKRTLIVIAALVASVSAIGEELPTIDYPTLSQLKALGPRDPLEKDPYETTAEYARRKSEMAPRGDAPLTFFGQLKLDYDADKEAYIVTPCLKRIIASNTEQSLQSGSNAMGAEWDWVEVTGEQYVVDAGHCADVELPYELAKAKAIRNDVRAIGKVSLKKQEPQRRGGYDAAEWGKTVVDRTKIETYRGEVESVYVGTSSTGVVAFLDLEEAKHRASLSEGEQYSKNLEAEVAKCNLRFRDYTVKLKEGTLELWGKMFQGNRRSNCKVEYRGDNVSFLVKVEGEQEPIALTPAMFRTTQAPFGIAQVHSSGTPLSKARDIESITLRINGNLEWRRGHNGIWPDGFEITKLIYAR